MPICGHMPTGMPRPPISGKRDPQVSGKPIDQLMPTFVLQPGVPMLTMAASCDQGKAQVEFTQQRFFLSSGAAERRFPRTVAGSGLA